MSADLSSNFAFFQDIVLGTGLGIGGIMAPLVKAADGVSQLLGMFV